MMLQTAHAPNDLLSDAFAFLVRPMSFGLWVTATLDERRSEMEARRVQILRFCIQRTEDKLRVLEEELQFLEHFALKFSYIRY